MNTPKPIDAYTPAQVASLVEHIGVTKAQLPVYKMFVLAVLAGAFIAFGAMLYTMVVTDSTLGYGLTRWLGGIAFSLGLILVVVAGAELFTGNNLIMMAWASRQITTPQVLRNWAVVFAGNMVGAIATAWMVSASGVLNSNGAIVAQSAMAIANAKVSIGFAEAFVSGVLCNVLVCLAVWLSIAAHSVSGKIMAIIFPVSAFVAMGFEHSVANMYFIPLGIFLGGDVTIWDGLVHNLLPVTLGNIVGGSGLVALVYWLCYLKE